MKLTISKGWNGDYYVIKSNDIDYDTFLEIGDNLSKEAIEYGKKQYGIVYPKHIEELSNDVSCSRYKYTTCESEFTASTKEDVENWLKLYNIKTT